ncbi:hypothetical protein EZV73_17955 [Acidaminobacter sp. JC074]|uniref:hypothetical protein n=1 Tax=Acidaminobacter sp. JC074 TaxID=2530199 RepID=UPI001F0F16FD|nr:hypothetical protein [Acidaminobacter sp. JC074]MCH4889470.1 hypothetical protein [Acidaminobacter sp. JC074]
MVSLRVSIRDICIMIVLPIFISAVFYTSRISILMYYLLLVGFLSTVDLDGIKKEAYGDLVYSRSVCVHKNCIYLILIASTVYIMTAWMGLSSFWTSAVIGLLYLILIRDQLSLVIYKNGILYKGRFYPIEDLTTALLVKNYKSEYELYLNKSRLIINSEELALTKRMS